MRREQRSIQVSALFEASSEELQLTCLSDWGGLEREITAPRIQKPGLALSGFVRHVYGNRVQVLGLTEVDYIMSCEPSVARDGLEKFCAKDISCIILTRGLEPPDVPARVPGPLTGGQRASVVSRGCKATHGHGHGRDHFGNFKHDCL